MPWNSHLLSLYISYKCSNKKLLKYLLIISCVIISLTLITTLFHKALTSPGEFWYWSLLGLKRLTVTKSFNSLRISDKPPKSNNYYFHHICESNSPQSVIKLIKLASCNLMTTLLISRLIFISLSLFRCSEF